MGNFHVDVNIPGIKFDKVRNFCNLFDLMNLIT